MKRDKLFTFIEVDVFRKSLDKLASLETLFAIQSDLISNPKRGAIISGTNGVRKARIADKKKKRGKSSSFRYLYLYLEKVGVVYLIVFFAKSDIENISKSDKQEISSLVERIKQRYKK